MNIDHFDKKTANFDFTTKQTELRSWLNCRIDRINLLAMEKGEITNKFSMRNVHRLIIQQNGCIKSMPKSVAKVWNYKVVKTDNPLLMDNEA